MKVVIYYDGRIEGGAAAALDLAKQVRADNPGRLVHLRDSSVWSDASVEQCDSVVLLHEAPAVAAAYEGKAQIVLPTTPAPVTDDPPPPPPADEPPVTEVAAEAPADAAAQPAAPAARPATTRRRNQ